MRRDDRDGSPQLQRPPLHFDWVNREANRNRAAPVTFAANLSATGRALGERQRLRFFVPGDHRALTESGVLGFADRTRIERLSVGPESMRDRPVARRGAGRARAAEPSEGPLADVVVDRLLLLRLWDLASWRRR